MSNFLKLFAILMLISCNRNPIRTEEIVSDNITVSKDKLKNELYSKLLEYQSKYPLPKQKRETDINLYEVFFYKTNNDTLMMIRRSAEGASPGNDELLFGPYIDNKLALTVIRDSKDFYSKNFITQIIVDTDFIKTVKPVLGKSYTESFPPVYNYKVSGNNLLFKKIDTVWNKWEE